MPRFKQCLSRKMDKKIIENFIAETWDHSIIPTLVEYIKIPNQSPMFDPQWEQNGYMQQAVELLKHWCHSQALKGMQLDVIQFPGRTPIIFMEIPGNSADTILLYGHLDKQPEMEGWDEELGPWKPVLKDGKLYGRGAADDGYSTFAAVTAIKALQQQNIPHARCIIIIEACEESGSLDLPFYIEHLKQRIGTPSLIICLDSGCGNYSQLWSTTSLRGIVSGTLTVEILKEGLHSGGVSGIVPCSFRIIRELLSRVEDEKTGRILLPELHVEIPKDRIAQAALTAEILGDSIYQEIPFVKNALPVTNNLTELLLNQTWRPTLSVIGAQGLPNIENAGNVLRPKTALKLSFRIPPTANPAIASLAVKNALEKNPPYNAVVKYESDSECSGWNAPTIAPWLASACDTASHHYFGKPCAYLGEGGTIPFMGMLGEKFPKAQFLITGVLGPHSNAHGPNEFLHLATAKKVTACIADVIELHAKFIAQ